MVHLNIRSLRKYFNEFLTLLKTCEEKIDLIILSEVNIKREELALYAISGYNIHANLRETKKGGGIIIYAKENLNFDVDIIDTSAAETLRVKLKAEKKFLHVIATYRPPGTNKLRFLKELNIIVKEIPPLDDVVVIGDMNIDILGDKINKTTTRYKNILCASGLQCAIPSTEITREQIVEGQLVTSCIDHLWVRASCAQRIDAHMLTCNISDHHMVGLRLDIQPDKNQPYDNNVIRYGLNNKKVREKLDLVNWSELLTIECPLIIYEKLGNIFGNIYEECKIELKLSSKRISEPWINKQLNNMLERRDNLFRAWKSMPSSMIKRLEYTKYRNKVNKIINAAKNKHRQEEIAKCNGDFRKIWGNINTWLGRNKSNLDSVIMRYLGKTDSLENICTNFATTFTQEIQNIKHKCKDKFLDRNSYVKKSNVSFKFRKVSSYKIEKIIDKLSNEKSPGIDKIRVQDIKYSKTELSKVLAKFITVCGKRNLSRTTKKINY